MLSLDRYPVDPQLNFVLDKVNIVFTGIFVFEMAVKLLAFGFKGYFRDPFNAFDSVIVLASLVDLVISNLNAFSLGGAITAFRAVRLLRIFKLAKSWKKLQSLLKTIGQTFKDISSFSVLLFIVMFVYSLLGMDLFGYQARFAADGYTIDMAHGTAPDANFDNFLEAFTAVFIVLTGDAWSATYFNYYRTVGGAVATLFFISLIIIGQKIMLNLFLAILLQNFDEDSLNEEMKEQFKERN